MTENQYIDADSYQGGSKDVTFEFIVMEHLRRITRIVSKEWHGGKMVYKRMTYGQQQMDDNAFYIESTSEAYTHAVECLMDLLLPRADERLLAFEEQNNKEANEEMASFRLFIKTGFWTKEQMQEAKEEEAHNFHSRKPGSRTLEEAKEITYRNIALVRRKLFREIILFLNRIDFFNAGGSYEEEIIE